MEHHTDKQRCKQFAEPLLQGLHCLPVVDCFHCEQIWKEKACEILSQEVMSLSIIISWEKKKKKKKKHLIRSSPIFVSGQRREDVIT